MSLPSANRDEQVRFKDDMQIYGIPNLLVTW